MERINWEEPRTPKSRESKDRPKRKPADPRTWQDWLDELKSELESPVEDNQTKE